MIVCGKLNGLNVEVNCTDFDTFVKADNDSDIFIVVVDTNEQSTCRKGDVTWSDTYGGYADKRQR